MPSQEETQPIRNFSELVLRHHQSKAPALIFSVCRDGVLDVQDQLSFEDLADQIRRVASQLRISGFSAGDRIAVAVSVSASLYVLVLAIMTMGGIPVLINPGSGLANIYSSLKNVRLKGIISGGPIRKWRFLLPVLWRVRKMMTFNTLSTLPIADDASFMQEEACNPRPSQPALITFTSGSSGRPKGVNRTHSILISQYRALKGHFPLLPGQIDLPAFPVQTLYNLCCGTTTVVPIVDYKAVSEVDPGVILAQIKHFGVTTMSGAPAYLKAITDHCISKNIVVPEIKGLAVGGAPVSSRLAMQIQAVFPGADAHILYGSSEAEPITSIAVKEYLDASEQTHQGYLVGKKAGAIHLRVIPLTTTQDGLSDSELPRHTIGEIIVSGNHVCKHYFRNPDADRKYKLRGQDAVVWHRTGDVGFMDEEDRLWLSGRLENMITFGKTRFFPYPLERVIETIPQVGRAAVTGTAAKDGITIFLEETQLSTLLEVSIRQLVSSHFNIGKITFHLVSRLPYDMRHQSKVSYPMLARMVGAH